MHVSEQVRHIIVESSLISTEAAGLLNAIGGREEKDPLAALRRIRKSLNAIEGSLKGIEDVLVK